MAGIVDRRPDLEIGQRLLQRMCLIADFHFQRSILLLRMPGQDIRDLWQDIRTHWRLDCCRSRRGFRAIQECRSRHDRCDLTIFRHGGPFFLHRLSRGNRYRGRMRNLHGRLDWRYQFRFRLRHGLCLSRQVFWLTTIFDREFR